MLNQIQFHIHEDEQRQQEIEHSLALEIRENYRLSLGALERFIPSLAELVKTSNSAVSTLLCNKYAEFNIVNYNSGQVLYGMHPKVEVQAHLTSYLLKSPIISLPKKGDSEDSVFVSLGLGLGYHLEDIVDKGTYKHVVVYEPNIDYFVCSLSSVKWREILKKAREAGIALYFQMGSDASNFCKDIQELTSHFSINQMFFYKHLNLPIFNSLEECLNTGDWEEVIRWKPRIEKASLNESYLPIWAPLCSDYEQIEAELDESKKNANLEAIKKFFPNLYEEFSNYSPKNWQPVAVSNGIVSVAHIKTHSLFSISPKNEANISYGAFKKRPNKDGLLLSYKGKKLKGYLHYQLVEACDEVIRDVTEVQSELPEQVKSLIMFGVGAGYSVEAIMDNHDVEMLFICEPNKDFFYASLYAINWREIIESFDEGKRRLYLNIGDDGSNLSNDLLAQFQSVGPYVLANTYFYQTHVNEKLADAVAQLREQLLVIIAMGDYFDNAKYGIAHTRWALENNIPFLRSDAKRRLPKHVLDVPVFIVGNGPSLDGLIDILKVESENAIVISCGTALQALYKNGITPDFHAEIETNRSTYDWLSRIDDNEYLKDIDLLSCNGVHPDSATLFKGTFLAMKQGEASTVSLTELDKKHPFALLNFAYPTVTNFVADFVTTVGFNQIYLFGTDMGFVSDSYHHSKSSGYYDGNGNELYCYADNHSMHLVIPGNFKPWVKTKYEFKVSKSVLEQVLGKSSLDVYNLNDGAKIIGAQPLKKEFVLLTSTPELKAGAKNTILSDGFTSELNAQTMMKFDKRFSTDSLIEELGSLLHLLDTSLSSKKEVDTFISEQREFIVSSYLRKKSLGFYYLNGTLNYVNSIFSKLLNIVDEDATVSAANRLLEIWRRSVLDILLVVKNDQFGLDNISPFAHLRRRNFLADYFQQFPVSVEQINNVPKLNTLLIDLTKIDSVKSNKAKILINWVDQIHADYVIGRNVCNIIEDLHTIQSNYNKNTNFLLAKGNFRNSNHPWQSNHFNNLNIAIVAALSGLEGAIFVPRISFHPLFASEFFDDVIDFSKAFYCYCGPDYIVLLNELLDDTRLLLPSSDRLSYIPTLTRNAMKCEYITEEQYYHRIKSIEELYDTL